MILRYGSVSFDAGSCEVTLDVQALVNQRNVPYCQQMQMSVSGYLSGDNTTAVNLACEQLEVALATPYRDLVLYTDAGLATHLALYNAGSTTGVIVSGPRYPSGKGAELVTYRKFEFTARAEYPIGTGRNVLMEFSESISFQGTGGPRFILKPALVGPPQKQIVQQRTTVRATQGGRAVGYLDYPTEPPPLWPQAEHLEQRQVTRTGGRFHGAAWQEFAVQWGYVFEANGPLAGKPTQR